MKTLPSSAEARCQAVLERWRRALATGTTPTREAWFRDLLELGPVDLRLARRLTGPPPAWPPIPPFEPEQLQELQLRARDSQAAAVLRRAGGGTPAGLPPSPTHASEPAATTTAHPQPTVAGAVDERRGAPPHSDSERPSPAGATFLRPTTQISPRHGGTSGVARSASSHRWPWHRPAWQPPRLTSALLALVVVLALVLFVVLRHQVPTEPVDPDRVVDRSSPVTPEPATLEPAPTKTPPDVRDTPDDTAALIRLLEALATSPRAEFQWLYTAHVAPISTLPADDIRQRPEVAAVILVLVARRAGPSPDGWATARPLLDAIDCGWIGDAGAVPCVGPPPAGPLDDLTSWVHGESTP